MWHTQGSGKSMEMELYAHSAARQPKLKNPTLVVVTDRTELDSQLFEAFNRSQLLPETPINVTTRKQLREELSQPGDWRHLLHHVCRSSACTDNERESGLDHPLLTDRRNIIVIVDEAHRSHYDDLDGFARHIRDALPNAAFIAFTGTPISTAERDTQEVFGSVIDTYDLTRAVTDGATVPVYFEPRLIAVRLAGDVSEDDLDAAADEVVTGLDEVERERIEKSVAVINAMYGAPARLAGAGRGHRRPLGEAVGSDEAVHRVAGQGVHRRCHPRDLRRPLRGDHQAAARLARRRRRQGRHQGRLLRVCVRHRPSSPSTSAGRP